MEIKGKTKAQIRLEEIKALRNSVEAIRLCLETMGEMRGNSASATEALSAALYEKERQLDALTEETKTYINRVPSPGEKLLLELIFLHGVEADAVTVSLGLSRSGFRSRFLRSLNSLNRAMGGEN